VATLFGGLGGVPCNGRSLYVPYRPDPRQLYRLELHFRQGYPFSTTMRLVLGIHKEFCSTARQVYALEAARLSFMAHWRWNGAGRAWQLY